MIRGIQEAVTIPVMAKCRIGHFVEAQVLEAIEIDYIDESEVLSPADDVYHIDKTKFQVPFVCGARDLGEALRRISEGASMIRTKGEPGTGDVVQAVRHMRTMNAEIRRVQNLREDELFEAAKELQVPVELLRFVHENGRLLLRYRTCREKRLLDITGAAYLFLGFWDLMSRLNLTHPVLAPPPENVFYVFVSQRELMTQGIFSSLRLLALGVGLALVFGVFFGLLAGWIPRLRGAVLPIANVISPIPPLVYTPYVVAVMPTFKAASIFVIFCAVFWPTFQNMVSRVGSIDKKIIQSAQVMDVSTPAMLFRVILPYCKPGILASLNGTIRAALLCLTGAELLGANSGLGYFVKKFSDYADYTKVIAGIILMGVVVTILLAAVHWLQKRLVKWDYT